MGVEALRKTEILTVRSATAASPRATIMMARMMARCNVVATMIKAGSKEAQRVLNAAAGGEIDILEESSDESLNFTCNSGSAPLNQCDTALHPKRTLTLFLA